VFSLDKSDQRKLLFGLEKTRASIRVECRAEQLLISRNEVVKNKKDHRYLRSLLEDNCLIKTYLNSGYPLGAKVFEINFGGKFLGFRSGCCSQEQRYQWITVLKLPLINTLFQGAGSKVLFFITEIQMLSKHHRLRWSLHVPTRKRGFSSHSIC
jgi:hypothetical protein